MTIGVHYLARAAQIAAKEEATAGTAVALAAGDVISRVGEANVAINNETVESIVTDITLSEQRDFAGIQAMDLSFAHYLKGSGAKTSPPDWSLFLGGAGFKGTVVTDTSVQFTPDSSFTIKTLSMKAIYRRSGAGNGKHYYGKGMRAATLAIVIPAGEPARLEWTWRGSLVSVTDAAIFGDPTAWLGGAGLNATVPQRVAGTALTIGAWTPRMRSLRIDINFDLAPIHDSADDSGILGYEVTRRNITGTLELKSVPVSEKNIITDLRSAATAALALTIGAVEGNIVDITAPAVQIVDWSEGDDEGLLGSTLALKFTGVAGDDELMITTR